MTQCQSEQDHSCAQDDFDVLKVKCPKRQMLTKIKIKSAKTQGVEGKEITEERDQWHESCLCVIWDAS